MLTLDMCTDRVKGHAVKCMLPSLKRCVQTLTCSTAKQTKDPTTTALTTPDFTCRSAPMMSVPRSVAAMPESTKMCSLRGRRVTLDMRHIAAHTTHLHSAATPGRCSPSLALFTAAVKLLRESASDCSLATSSSVRAVLEDPILVGVRARGRLGAGVKSTSSVAS